MDTDQTSPQEPGERPLDTLRALVLSAFEAAKKPGRADWESMTTGVLKNRILQATAREFDERDYGVTTFTEAIRLIPDLVELDETTWPLRARLIAPDAAEGAEAQEGKGQPIVGAGRIRTDLWDAVLDYTWDGVYVWDGSRAVRVAADEVGDRLRLPTISSDDMAAWRQDFANQHTDRELDEWVQHGHGTLALPPDLRKPWNQLVKSNAVDILSTWFRKQGLEMPEDTFASSASKRASPDHIEAEELRRFLLRCVAVMRPSELKAVQIPASVAFRARA
ncbi:MAG: OST-HTH/LOTUS domain-containing protein [Actinomycetota bacterium]|nr:OST-HTH/LOTUS domain-containing protein [Actinomycetota bacterium]